MGERWQRYRRWSITKLGRAWVFWPVLVCGAVARNGWDRWGSITLWVVALLLAGPGLAMVIHRAHRRRGAAAPV